MVVSVLLTDTDAMSEIIPDDKDWTWVIERRCPECGFDGREVAPEDVADLLRANARRWRELIDAAEDADRVAEFRRRSRPDRWSELEYAVHVRDVFRLYHERLHLMLDRDDPMYPNWDQDRAAVDGDYAAHDPSEVATQIVADAERLASAFDSVHGEQWERPGRRSDGAAFTVSTFARYLLHDPVHHLWDVSAD